VAGKIQGKGEKPTNRQLETICGLWQLMAMKIIIEKHPEGYVAYPAGIQGVVVGQGNTYEEALQDVQSAIRFHIETFGRDALESEDPALDAFVAEATI
jgi:predicted RNase H-like HicB family nuclease